LHGTWTAVDIVTSSDARLKTNIRPLTRELLASYRSGMGSVDAKRIAETYQPADPTSDLKPIAVRLDQVSKYEDRSKSELDALRSELLVTNSSMNATANATSKYALTDAELESEMLLGMLRHLRPVSFKYKQTQESKYSRFGFIAQEIDTVLPDVVRVDKTTGKLSLQLNDLIAVLTLGLQSLDARLLRLDGKVADIKQKVDTNYVSLSDRLKSIETIIRRVLEQKRKASGSPSLSAPRSRADVTERSAAETQTILREIAAGKNSTLSIRGDEKTSTKTSAEAEVVVV
jgi:hypothetical protein